MELPTDAGTAEMAAIANAKAPFRFFLARRLGGVPVSQPHLPSLRQLGDQSQGLADLRDRSDGCDPISKPFTSAKSVEGLAGIDGSRSREAVRSPAWSTLAVTSEGVGARAQHRLKYKVQLFHRTKARRKARSRRGNVARMRLH